MSWTLNFFKEWLPQIDLPSTVRLWNFVLGKRTDDFELRLRRWGPVHLRALGGGDYRMFDLMFRLGTTPPIIPGCQTVIDLGGNIGLATIALARELPDLQSYVVEPDAGNIAMLERNLAPLVQKGRCRIERGAFWKKDELIEIVPPAVEGSFGAIRCVDSGGGGEKVQGMTMQTILDHAGFERVNLLKIDIEGAEAGLFEAGEDWLERVDTIAVEFHGAAREESDFDRVVGRHGLRMREAQNNGVIASRTGAAD